MYADARAAYDWVRMNTGTKVAVHGESLGGAVACQLGSIAPCDGLIMQSTFTSVRDFLPRAVRVLSVMGPRFDSLSRIREIACPKLFMHSRSDEMIPFDMGRRLFDAASEPKESAWFDGVGHNEMPSGASSMFYDRIAGFLTALAA